MAGFAKELSEDIYGHQLPSRAGRSLHVRRTFVFPCVWIYYLVCRLVVILSLSHSDKKKRHCCDFSLKAYFWNFIFGVGTCMGYSQSNYCNNCLLELVNKSFTIVFAQGSNKKWKIWSIVSRHMLDMHCMQWSNRLFMHVATERRIVHRARKICAAFASWLGSYSVISLSKKACDYILPLRLAMPSTPRCQ